MLSVINSISLLGLDGNKISVEVDISNGMPAFDIVGLPDATVKESKERVRAAIKNSGYEFPAKRIIINLAPADLRKDGTSFDLPIALGILISSDQIIPENNIEKCYFMGELSLNGSICSIKGVLPSVSAIAKLGNNNKIFLPIINSQEGALVGGADVYGVTNLNQLVNHLEGKEKLTAIEVPINIYNEEYCGIEYIDMKDIKGQSAAKRAMEIAAAGCHNILLIGVPGSGKTMMAKSLPGILPSLTKEESIEITKIYSMAGLLGDKSLITKRPFRSPHHTSSAVSLIGGGRYPKPGEISLAYHGVLFLDEMVEFPKSVLEVLRQPLEDNVITVSRAAATITFPAEFQLVGACNPCPCGFHGDPEKECICTPHQINKYLGRLSGPLLDRIDLHVEISRITYDELADTTDSESSAEIKARVEEAKSIQINRYKKIGITCNAQLNRALVKKYCKLDEEGIAIMSKVFKKLNLSARAHDRILKVARTIADLDGEKNILAYHVAEAVQYRNLDRLL